MSPRFSPGTGPENPDGRDPRPRLALIYAAKFGHLGIVMPFLAPWIQGRGMGPAAIGVLLALPALFKILAPWCWGRWADRSGRRRELLAVAALTAAAALAGLVFSGGPLVLALLMLLYSFARAPVLPYVEATSLEQSDLRGYAYGPVRLWGSLAFVVTSSGVGALSGWISLEAGLLAAAAMLAFCGVLGPTLPAPVQRGQRDAPEDGTTMRRLPPGLVRFLAACALMQVSHGAYYTFYSIRLQDLGYGGAVIGSLWAFAVICEILLFSRMDRIVQRLGAQAVMVGCLLVAAARWLLIGLTTALPLLVVGQALHAFTYAAFHVAAIRVVYDAFGPGRRARGQAMYSGMTFGLGIFLGSLVAGWLVGPLGLPAVFAGSSAVALVALLVLGGSARSLLSRGPRSPGRDPRA
jgi:PPP family 3-phenylpropionic acid transporter